MRRIIALSRYFAVIGVVFSLVASLAGFGSGAYKTVALVLRLASGATDGTAVALVQIVDTFLIAVGILIFALALYELFVGEIDLPGWLVIRDLDALKVKLVGVIVLVMTVTFLERLESGMEARDVLYIGIAVAVVSAALVFFARGVK